MSARDFAARRLPLVHFVVDAAVFALAIPVATFVRYDFSLSHVGWSLLPAMLLAVALQGLFGLLYGQYRRRWQFGSFDEVMSIAAAALSVGAVLTVALWWDLAVPRSVPALAAVLSLLGQVALRSAWRAYTQSKRRESVATESERLIVIGGGEVGTTLTRMLVTTRDTALHPVAILDDDPAKRNLRVSGVRVMGATDDLEAVSELTEADAVLIAMPSASGEAVRRIDEVARGCGLRVLATPPVDQLFGGVGLGDIRPISHDDLLGRRIAEIDPVAIAHYVTGRRVLVTGAGGSIGGELCRQIGRFEPGELLMLDRDESGLHGTQLSIEGRAMLDGDHLILADIRDAARMDEVFARHRPEIVFHAAALKHLPLLESHPAEGWKTNVLGTLNLLEAANRHDVGLFVNVSTDKAANPTSVLGWTKRITERLTAAANDWDGMTAVSVRFGNVLGSQGSVLKTFEAQAEQGGPITVTHPDITRYFMTMQEAARLIVQAGAIGEPGEIMILDMGEPVRIVDVAQRFAEQHDPPLEIVFTGLRPNEKLHEDLVSDGERGVTRSHPMINHVAGEPLHGDQVREVRPADGDEIAAVVGLPVSQPVSSDADG